MSDFASEQIEKQKDRIKNVEQELALGTSRGKTLSHQELSSRRGSLKSMKEDLAKMERAMCRHQVEEIKTKIESRGGQLSPDRITELKKLTPSAIANLNNEIGACQAAQEQTTLIDRAIADLEKDQDQEDGEGNDRKAI